MFTLSDLELQNYIQEDVPLLDLTTHIQGIKSKKAKVEIFTREDIIVSCSEEAARIAELLGCKIESVLESATAAKSGDVLLSFSGDYNDVHKAYRSSQVIMEYSCKMATYAHDMLKIVKTINPHCELLTTRKTYPFAKKFSIKSILVGGALPHRLSLSETIVFFESHRVVYGSNELFYAELKNLKLRVPEKRVVVESSDITDAKELLKFGADVLQMDKVDFKTLKELVEFKNSFYPQAKILAAGGINLGNAKEYASALVDGLVTSSIYTCGMANIGTRITLVSE